MAVVDCGGDYAFCYPLIPPPAEAQSDHWLYIHQISGKTHLTSLALPPGRTPVLSAASGRQQVGPRPLAILSSAVSELHPGRHDRRRKGPDHCQGRWEGAGPADHPGTAGQNRRSCYRVGLLRSRSCHPRQEQQPHPCHRRFAGAGVFLRRNCRCAEGLQRPPAQKRWSATPYRAMVNRSRASKTDRQSDSRLPLLSKPAHPLPDSLLCFAPWSKEEAHHEH